MQISTEEKYQIKTDFNNMKFEEVSAMLSRAFRSAGIQKDEVKQGAWGN